MKSDNNSKLFILKNSRICWDENLKIMGQFLISIKAINTWFDEYLVHNGLT
jgi:hypothetical protein